MRAVKGFLGRHAIVIALLCLWELSSRLNWTDSSYLPPPSVVAETVFEMWNRVNLFMHLMVSLFRVLASLLLASALGILSARLLSGLLKGAYPWLESLFKVSALVNPYCLFPLFIVFFGPGEYAKIAVLSWVSFWPVFFNSYTAFKNVDPLLVKTARSMGASGASIFFQVTLPQSLPSVFNGIRVGVQMAFFILIAAEMTGAVAGLGWIVHSAGALNQVDRIYGAGLLIVLSGFFLNRFLNYLDRGLFFWKETDTPPNAADALERPVKPLSALKLSFIGFAVFLVMALGVYQLYRAEIMLNDPSVVPEYRIWTE
ncbi:MAG: ABC transporter permease [Deltaproteobacteria bacterium]|nr:ABC transporter permease [Deltaproteobacteria bacterium]